jgi:hypothetical protein
MRTLQTSAYSIGPELYKGGIHHCTVLKLVKSFRSRNILTEGWCSPHNFLDHASARTATPLVLAFTPNGVLMFQVMRSGILADSSRRMKELRLWNIPLALRLSALSSCP